MMVQFPAEKNDLSPDDAFIAYKHLVDYHLHYLRLQSKCEFFYWKLMGVFFLCIMGAFILRDKGIVTDPLIMITVVSFGCLLVFAQNVRTGLEYGASAASCVEKGIHIEDKYAYPTRLFRIFEDNKILTYRSNLLSRTIPFTFIGLVTAGTITFLAMKLGIWLPLVAAILSVSALCIAARSYIKIARKILLGNRI